MTTSGVVPSTKNIYPTLLSIKNHLFKVFLSLLLCVQQSIKCRLPENCDKKDVTEKQMKISIPDMEVHDMNETEFNEENKTKG